MAYKGFRTFHPNAPERGRDEIGLFSKRSRKRLAFVANNTPVEFNSLLTLTYPNLFPGNGKEVKRHLRAMLKRLRRRLPHLSYLWWLEFQRRGAPHIHMLLTYEVTREAQGYVSVAWYEIVGSGDARHLRAGTRLERIRSQDGARRYAVKYAMKMKQKKVPRNFANVGRFWGHSKNVSPRPIGEPIPIETLTEAREKLAEWSYVNRLTRPMTILYNASDSLAGCSEP